MTCESATRSTDGELLACYAGEGSESAFAELVDRYQAMVLRVCRQVLGGSQDADDAAQQVFVALSMKAAALCERESIASWLYRVAWNISDKLRRARYIRKTHESLAGTSGLRIGPADGPEPDTLHILQEALAEIPEIYREAIVLHYFCGYTVAESAARLRCPAGTFAARVSRGLKRLRCRLSDRGLILSAAGIKLLMLGTMRGSKAAAAAAAVPKGGLPAFTRGYRRVSQSWNWRVGRAIGLLPMGATLSAYGGSMLPSLASSSAPANVLAKLNAAALLYFLQTKAKQAAICLLVAMFCASAGAATIVVVDAASSLVAGPSKTFSPPADASKDAGATARAKADNSEQTSASSGSSSQSYAGVAAVPEPGSFGLLGGAAVALMGRRRRTKNGMSPA